MKTKTIEEIMRDPMIIDEIIRQAEDINRLIRKTKKAGIYWPETEDNDNYDICPHCDGTGCCVCGGKGIIN